MSLEQKVEDLTAAVLVLAKAFSEHASAGTTVATAPKAAKAAKAPKAPVAPEPVAPEPEAAEPEAAPAAVKLAAVKTAVDVEEVRAKLVAVQNAISREKALEILAEHGEAKTVGTVAVKNFKAVVAACDAALAAVDAV